MCCNENYNKNIIIIIILYGVMYRIDHSNNNIILKTVKTCTIKRPFLLLLCLILPNYLLLSSVHGKPTTVSSTTTVHRRRRRHHHRRRRRRKQKRRIGSLLPIADLRQPRGVSDRSLILRLSRLPVDHCSLGSQRLLQ